MRGPTPPERNRPVGVFGRLVGLAADEQREAASEPPWSPPVLLLKAGSARRTGSPPRRIPPRRCDRRSRPRETIPEAEGASLARGAAAAEAWRELVQRIVATAKPAPRAIGARIARRRNEAGKQRISTSSDSAPRAEGSESKRQARSRRASGVKESCQTVLVGRANSGRGWMLAPARIARQPAHLSFSFARRHFSVGLFYISKCIVSHGTAPL